MGSDRRFLNCPGKSKIIPWERLSYCKMWLNEWMPPPMNLMRIHTLRGLKEMVQWACLQNRNRLTDAENKFMVIRGERGGDKLGVWDSTYKRVYIIYKYIFYSYIYISIYLNHFVIHLKLTTLSSVFQSCLTPCGPMDCSPLGSSVHGIFQARILE